MPRRRNSPQEPSNNPDRVLIGYARVSTSDQDLARQIDALKAHGVEGDHLYTDKASGSSMRRRGLEHALLDARRGDVLVAVSVDRISRSLKDLIALAERLHADGIELRILHQNVDTTTPMGRAFFHIIAVIAELERALIAERTRHGMEVAKRERGQKFGPRPTFGPKQVDEAIRIWRAAPKDEKPSAEELGRRFGVTGQVVRLKVYAKLGGKRIWKKVKKPPKRVRRRR